MSVEIPAASVPLWPDPLWPDPLWPDPLWDVLCLGEALVAFSQQADGLYIRREGGDASTVAVAVSRMGGQAAITRRIGTDGFGDQMMQAWAGAGVDSRAVIRDPNAATGHYFTNFGAQSGMEVYRDGSAAQHLRPGDLAAGIVARARVLHLSGISFGISASAGVMAMDAVIEARGHGTRVSFDPNYRADLWSEGAAVERMLEILPLVDVIFPTISEAEMLLSLSDPTTVLDRFLELGPQVVVLRMGPNGGAWLATRTGRCHLPAIPHEMLDPIGASDTYIGTFLSGLTAGDDLVATANRAGQAAAFSAARIGSAVPGMLDLVA